MCADQVPNIRQQPPLRTLVCSVRFSAVKLVSVLDFFLKENDGLKCITLMGIMLCVSIVADNFIFSWYLILGRGGLGFRALVRPSALVAVI